MVGSGPLNSENITGLLKNLDKALDEAGWSDRRASARPGGPHRGRRSAKPVRAG